MATLLILLLFLDLSAGLRAGAAATGREDCKPKRCNSGGPDIRPPFWLKDNEQQQQQQQQPEHCGYPGFDLSCDHENLTMLELPFSVKVAVKEIDYISQSIHTYDPHDCFPRLLQNLYLSTTTCPFQLAMNHKYNLSFFSCSSTEPISYNPITCLSSDPNHKVYAFKSESFMFRYPLLSCKKMPFKISSPIPSGIFDKQPYELILNWCTPTCGSCDTPQSRTTAKGIDYLHQGCNQRILHFDIKPHNILLDHNFNPKISDFGLAKLCSKEQSVVSMTTARGTVGYIAPEVFSRNFGKVSCKSDVYSFGMLLLEMVGVRNNNVTQATSEVYFPEWIYNRLENGEDLEVQIDEDGDAQIVKTLTIVGLWCIHWYPVDRPSMKVVVQMLEGDGGSLTMPSNPFASANPMTTRGQMRGRPLNSELEDISESESFSD